MLFRSLDYPKNAMEIICVDNGSTGGSRGAIKDFFDRNDLGWNRLLLIGNAKNIGAAAAYNLGFKNASEQADYIWKLDNDLIVEKNSLNMLLEKFDHDQWLGIAGSVVFPLFSVQDYAENFKGNAEIGCKISYFSTNIYKTLATYDEIGRASCRERV